MQCSKCRFKNPTGMVFCVECGNKLESPCPNCGFENFPDFKFCGKCGQRLSEADEIVHIDYAAPESYTPKHLAEKILTTRSSIEGERKLVTVLFADVANYTSMSERLDPEEVHQIMDGCFKILMDEIHKYEGTINQFTGDGVMALFGAPVAHEDHAQRACRAALAIQKAMLEFGAKLEKDTGVLFQMRIGINSGPVIVGAIGDDLRMDYTAVGDTTNLASRMEGLAKPGTAVVTGNTHRLVRDYFEMESMGPVDVKGKREPQEVYQLIKSSDVTSRFEASVAKGPTKFVGRKNSMAALMEVYEKVLGGSGQVVGLVGEAGVGKSRLLLEFRNRIDQDLTYLEGRCLQFGSSMAFLPLLDILRLYCGIEEGEREYLVKKKLQDKIIWLDENLTWTIPSFQDLLSVHVDDEHWQRLEPKEKREKTFEALRDLLIRESQNRLLILTIEDLHWMDKSSEEFLGYFIDWMAGARILLLLLYRPEYNHQWGSKTYYNRIGLDQLTIKSSAELVQAVLGQGEIVPELREMILGRAAGNPLFMEELTHTLIENGSIEKKDNRFVLNRKIADIQVPDTIQGIIAARMDRLEDNLKRTMQVASVIGRDFAFRLLQSITGMREELKSHLLNLQGLEFIYEKQLFPDLEYIFKHALTQEVAYNSLLLKRRKEIHENIGRAIERIYVERMEEFYEMLAYHYSKSDNLEKAYQYLKLSGIKSVNHHAAWEGYDFYGQALDVLDRMPVNESNKKKQVEVILLAYVPMFYLGFPEDSLSILKRAEDVSLELGDEKSLATTYSMLARCHVTKINSRESLVYSEKALALAQKIQDVDLMAQIAPGICMSYGTAGHHQKVVEIALPVIDLLEKTGKEIKYFSHPANVYSLLCGLCSASIATLGDFKEAKIICEKGLHNARELSDLLTSGTSEIALATLYNWKGDWQDSIEHVKNGMEYYSEINYISYSGVAHALLGRSYSQLGDYQSANYHFEKCLNYMEETGNEFGKTVTSFFLGAHYFSLGDPSSSRKYLEEALSLSREKKEVIWEGFVLSYLGWLLGKTDLTEFETGEKKICKGIELLENLGARPAYSLSYLFLGDLYIDAGRIDEAREYLIKAGENFQHMGMDFWLGQTREALERLEMH